MTTVGYGDMGPTSDASKWFTVAFAVYGVASVSAAVMTISKWVVYHQNVVQVRIQRKLLAQSRKAFQLGKLGGSNLGKSARGVAGAASSQGGALMGGRLSGVTNGVGNVASGLGSLGSGLGSAGRKAGGTLVARVRTWAHASPIPFKLYYTIAMLVVPLSFVFLGGIVQGEIEGTSRILHDAQIHIA